MHYSPSLPLSSQERIQVFKLSTIGLEKRFGDSFASGMSNAELKAALEQVLGIFGGSGGPGRLSVCFKGSGLRIWGGHRAFNHIEEKPLFIGATTIAMAREIYGIIDPELEQMALL